MKFYEYFKDKPEAEILKILRPYEQSLRQGTSEVK